MKKIGILFATFVFMMLFAVSVSALEPTGQCGDNVYWTFNESTGELFVSGEGLTYDYYDSRYDYNLSPFYCNEDIISVEFSYGVKSIGDSLFYNCSNLIDVIVPGSVSYIGANAFEGCRNLIDINIPKGITAINSDCFMDCISLKSVYLPEGITEIYDEAFRGCTNLETVYLPNSLEKIHLLAFELCLSLENITIPANVEYIDEDSFDGCIKLKYIYVNPENKNYISEDGILFDINKTVLINYPAMLTKNSYEIPLSVKKIKSHAFEYNKQLNKIIIPYSVKEIGSYAFLQCSNLNEIQYKGTKEMWDSISIGYGNDFLKKENIIFEEIHEHVYKCVSEDLPSHTVPGQRLYECLCGDTKVEILNKTLEHHYIFLEKVLPTCEVKGYDIYICACGDSYSDNYTSAKGHSYNGQTCIECGDNCSCNCHKGGFMGFIWKIINFFNKLFKSKQYCSCGAKHW